MAGGTPFAREKLTIGVKFSWCSDGGNILDLQVSHLTPEGTKEEEEGLRNVENWLTDKHDGLFHSVFIDRSDNKIKIKCYCNSTFVVGLNRAIYFKSHFTTHKNTCTEIRRYASIERYVIGSNGIF